MNRYRLAPGGRTAIIFLTRGRVALVDAVDLPLVLAFRWCALQVRHYWYAVTDTGGRRQYMHRLIAGAPVTVDHINFNGLDNRRENLRPARRAENCQHQRKARMVTTSRYKGVYAYRRRWRAKITANGRQWSAVRATELEAARWYNQKALQLHGEFALLNDLPGDA